MASAFSHPVIPLAIWFSKGKLKVSGLLLFLGALLSIAPDFDVLAFRFDIPYESQWGHRGFTHSFVFSALIAAVFSLFHRKLGASAGWCFIFLFISMASHGVLDAMTSGGKGVAFFWPFTDERYFLPWRPIKVSPIGVANFFSEWGWNVIKSEALWIWIPALGIGLLGRRLFKSKLLQSDSVESQID